MSKGRTFTYEVLLRIEQDEDSPDMPTLNVRTLGNAIAAHVETMTDCSAVCTVAHLTKNEPRKRRPPKREHVEAFLDGLVAGGTANIV